MPGNHLGHVIQRRNQTVTLAAVFGAFAQRKDCGIRRAHVVGNDDAASGFQAGGFGEIGVRTNAHRHHHHRRIKPDAVFEFDADHLAAIAEDLLAVGFGDDVDAEIGEGLFEQIARRRIELALHQRRHQMQHGYVHALHFQTGGRFKAQQATADHNRTATGLGNRDHPFDVVQIAIGQHAVELMAGQGNDHWIGAGGNHQMIVLRGDAVV